MLQAGKLATVTLILSAAMMTHGLRLHTTEVKKFSQRSDAALSDGSLVSQKMATSTFDLMQCLNNMPYLKYMSNEGASFCRVYAYSCNNFWAENLASEVKEGSFCIINWQEQSHALEEATTSRKGYQTKMVVGLIAPFYNFQMNLFRFEHFEKPEKAASTSAALAQGSHSGQKEFCTPKVGMSDGSKVKCMIQNMKLNLHQVKDAKLNMSHLSLTKGQQLFKEAQSLASGLAVFEEGNQVLNEQLKEANKSDIGIPGPLETSLGGFKYYFTPGMVGKKVSGKLRFPWDHVQPGLIMHAMDLTDIDPQAVCNDGSPALMFMNQMNTKKWHFHIDGGFFCYDKASCLMRAKMSATLVSSNGWERSKNNSGMFDPHMGGFPDYTHAAIMYCSSDAWMGRMEAEEFQMVSGTKLSNGKEGTYFRGYTILQAALKKFLMMGMGSSPDHELFVSGCSAGSIAATAMADSWGKRVSALAAEAKIPNFHEPRVWSLLDGAPIVSPPAVKEEFPPIFDMAMKLVTLLYGPERGVSPNDFINQNCVAANPGNLATCVWTGSVLPHIQTPNIVLNQLWDNFVTGQMYSFFNPTTPMQYSEGLHAVKMAREQIKLIGKSQNYFSVACGDHCVSDNPNFWRTMPATAKGAGSTTSAKDMTLQTRDGELGNTIIDECDDYNCGCVGQNSAYTKMAFQTLFLSTVHKMTGMWTPMPQNSALALAAGQTENPGQFFILP